MHKSNQFSNPFLKNHECKPRIQQSMLFPHRSVSTLKIIMHDLSKYNSFKQRIGSDIDKLVKKESSKAYTQFKDIAFDTNFQNMEKVFKRDDLSKELKQLIDYYKYYKNCPLVKSKSERKIMVAYWERAKAFYYRKIKKMLHLQIQDIDSSSSQKYSKNTFQIQDKLNVGSSSTFYIMNFINQIKNSRSITDNNLREKEQSLLSILAKLKSKKLQKAKTKNSIIQLEDNKLKKESTIEKTPKRKFKIQQRENKSNQKKKKHHRIYNSCKSVPAQHCSMNFYQKVNQNNSKLKKNRQLNGAVSCENIVSEKNANLRRKSQAKNPSKVNSPPNSPIRNKKKIKVEYSIPQSSNKKKSDKTMQAVKLVRISKTHRKSQQIPTMTSYVNQSQTVKHIIKNVKQKIKQEKSMMLKKYVESCQSYVKSTDSTSDKLIKVKK